MYLDRYQWNEFYKQSTSIIYVKSYWYLFILIEFLLYDEILEEVSFNELAIYCNLTVLHERR